MGRLADPAVGAELARACVREFPGNGAGEAAELVTRMLAGERAAPAVRDRGRFNRWLRLSSHAVGPSLPLVAALGTRDLIRNPERRNPYLVVLALGLDDDVLIERLEEAMAGTPPSRVLVLTDSLAFSALRRLGVGFELLPPWPGAGAAAATSAADLRARVELLLRGRRPLRAVSVGAHGEELLGLNPPPTASRGNG